ncbi:MAG: AAA family ATPase, partial [Deltaproteobacteria bacterium]|nr:AAA family ATPase [Deltaproteobacteria bacterium]
MIRRFSVTNLNKRLSCDLTFHPDINVITGRNGSGKTTLLRLLWYMTSGNI